MQAEGNTEGVKRGIISGTNQILFFMIPFAMYLAVFSLPLVTLYHVGAFSLESVSTIARFLSVFAIALPFYAVFTYMQKVCSSLRVMNLFALFNVLASAVQIAITLFAAAHANTLPIETIGVAEGVFYFVAELCVFVYLHRRFGSLGLRSTARTIATSCVLGALGAFAGAVVMRLLQGVFGPLSGSLAQAFCYLVLGGCCALVVTFGLALKLRIPQASFLLSIVNKVKAKLPRRG
jgi:putative peptidoglycan lipid II flippase